MTVSSTVARNDYIGTGSTSVYPYTFRIFSSTHLKVVKRDTSGVETTLALSTDYTVSGVGNVNGGNVTLSGGNLPSGYSLTIRRVLPLLQSTDIRNQGAFLPEIHEDQFDREVMIEQQQQDVLDRSIKLPETEAGSAANVTLPAAAQRASKFFAWDASGNPTAAASVTGAPVSPFMATVLDDLTASDARNTLGVTAEFARVDGDVDVLQETVAKPNDFLLGAFFRGNGDLRIDLYTSMNGEVMSRLNATTLRLSSGADVAGRDPSICFHDGTWYMAVTEYSYGVYDFVIFKSRDLITWTRHQCKLGSTAVGSATVPMPGGSQPASLLWAPELNIVNGVLHVLISIRYGNDFVDVDSQTIPHLVPFYSACTDLNTLAFASPTKFNLGADTGAKIDGDLHLIGGSYKLFLKNENTKNIEIWTGASISSTFSLTTTVDFTKHVEGPSLVFLNNENKYRLFVDAYAELGVGYYKDSTDLVTWGSEVRIMPDYAIRHGTVLNLANVTEGDRAVYAAMTAKAAGGWSDTPIFGGSSTDLGNGSVSITPQERFCYTVGGTNNVTLTVLSAAARVFYLLVASDQASAGITIVSNSVFPGAAKRIGFGRTNNRIYKVVLHPTFGSSGQYYVEGLDEAEDETFVASSTGYRRLAGGLIMQWGVVSNGGTGSTASGNFPIAFPNAVFGAVVSTHDGGGGSQASVNSISASAITVRVLEANGAVPARGIDARYLVVGW